MPPSKASVKESVKAPAVKASEPEAEQINNGASEVKVAEVVLSAEDAIAYQGWIPMTHDEHLAAQEQGVLMGYDPIKGLGLVQVKEINQS